MSFSNAFERLGRAVFESPFGANKLSKDAPELAEIRVAALEEVRAKSHRLSDKNVFPYELIRIHLLGVPDEQGRVFQSDFLLKQFAAEIKEALKRSSYRFPESLSVQFETSPRLPVPGEKWLVVEAESKTVETESVAPDTDFRGVLKVSNGTANHSEILLNRTRINIGRTVEVFRSAGPSRRNDLAFLGDDEISRTVSREHAHILRSTANSEYRLFNDRVYKGDENCGVWIVRDGLSYPVHRSSRGTPLRSGDEIHLGSATLIFSFEP